MAQNGSAQGRSAPRGVFILETPGSEAFVSRASALALIFMERKCVNDRINQGNGAPGAARMPQRGASLHDSKQSTGRNLELRLRKAVYAAATVLGRASPVALDVSCICALTMLELELDAFAGANEWVADAMALFRSKESWKAPLTDLAVQGCSDLRFLVDNKLDAAVSTLRHTRGLESSEFELGIDLVIRAASKWPAPLRATPEQDGLAGMAKEIRAAFYGAARVAAAAPRSSVDLVSLALYVATVDAMKRLAGAVDWIGEARAFVLDNKGVHAMSLRGVAKDAEEGLRALGCAPGDLSLGAPAAPVLSPPVPLEQRTVPVTLPAQQQQQQQKQPAPPAQEAYRPPSSPACDISALLNDDDFCSAMEKAPSRKRALSEVDGAADDTTTMPSMKSLCFDLGADVFGDDLDAAGFDIGDGLFAGTLDGDDGLVDVFYGD